MVCIGRVALCSFMFLAACNFFPLATSRSLSCHTHASASRNNQLVLACRVQQHTTAALEHMQSWRNTDAGRSVVRELKNQPLKRRLIGNAACPTLTRLVGRLNDSNDSIALTVRLPVIFMKCKIDKITTHCNTFIKP